jgi:hypothetical protein
MVELVSHVWLKNSGQEVDRTSLFRTAPSDGEANPKHEKSVEIRLPRDFSAVTTALIDHLGRGTRSRS